MLTVGIKNGKNGVHEWDIRAQPVSNITFVVGRLFLPPRVISNVMASQCAYLIVVLSPPIFLFIKITFFIMYRQVFNPMRWMRVSADLGAVLTTVFYTVITVCEFIFATPRRKETWVSHSITRPERLNILFVAPISVVGLAIDIYILILPIVAVNKLQMPARRKVGIMLIFMTGLLYVDILSLCFTCPSDTRLTTLVRVWDRSLASTIGSCSREPRTLRGLS